MRRPAVEVFDLGPVEAIPLGEGRNFDLGPLRVAVFRSRNGTLYATQVECPHKQGPLVDGLVGGSWIVCPMHGYQYDLITGKPVGHSCGALTVFPVSTTEAGNVIVEVAP